MVKRPYVLRRLGIDQHGQPITRTWNAPRLAKRSLDELLGICKGLVADRVLVEEESTFLLRWLQANQHVLETWPASVIADRIDLFLADGKIDQEERADLFGLLAEVVGQTNAEAPPVNSASALPLTKPAPPVFFTGKRFCITGHFAGGTRQGVESEITERGGLVQPNVTQETDYLVVGAFGSTDWIHPTHGRKLEKAMAYAARGLPIAIISEEHWKDHLL